jgi:glycolate oxidase FAD binding subunit
MTDGDLTQRLAEQVREAGRAGRPLRIRGGDSKAFYGRESAGEPLDLAGHRGILSYEPTELVITARAGTPLAEIEDALDAEGQMLPFEPPRFATTSTIGGAVASGLAGPRRPWGGAPRDLLLGIRMLDGRGQELRFGGEVMKNVAGYDLSRLMAGALGTLGVLLEVSLKVLPRPALEHTLSLEVGGRAALDLAARLQQRPLPLTGAFHLGERLYLRLAAVPQSARQLAAELGAERSEGNPVWDGLRDQTLAFFRSPLPLWRLSVPPASRPSIPGEGITDWGGAQRWVCADTPAESIRAAAEAVGGHATLFRNRGRTSEVFHPLATPVAALHRRLKAVFDPQGILNPGRLYPEW